METAQALPLQRPHRPVALEGWLFRRVRWAGGRDKEEKGKHMMSHYHSVIQGIHVEISSRKTLHSIYSQQEKKLISPRLMSYLLVSWVHSWHSSMATGRNPQTTMTRHHVQQHRWIFLLPHWHLEGNSPVYFHSIQPRSVPQPSLLLHLLLLFVHP